MFARIANILGWAGVALVVRRARGAVRPPPTTTECSQGLAFGGLACILVYIVSQWREIADAVTRRQARYGTLSLVSVLVGARHPARRQLHRQPPEQALGSDLVEGVRALGSDEEDPARPQAAAEAAGLRARGSRAAVPRSPGGVHLPVEAGAGRVHRSARSSRRSRGSIRFRTSAPSRSTIRDGSSGSPARPSRT